MDLIEFLRARLDEDEAAAKAAHPGPWTIEDGCFVVRGDAWCIGADPAATVLFEPEDGRDTERAANAAHIARHDPARVLADVAAKRAIVDYAQTCEQQWEMHVGEVYSTAEYVASDHVLRHLAAPFADHPDYRQEWKP